MQFSFNKASLYLSMAPDGIKKKKKKKKKLNLTYLLCTVSFFWLEVANLSGVKDFAFSAYYNYKWWKLQQLQIVTAAAPRQFRPENPNAQLSS